jgi:hypothetical protein
MGGNGELFNMAEPRKLSLKDARWAFLVLLLVIITGCGSNASSGTSASNCPFRLGRRPGLKAHVGVLGTHNLRSVLTAAHIPLLRCRCTRMCGSQQPLSE